MTWTTRDARVTIEGSPVWPAKVDCEDGYIARWNGWVAAPYFDRETAQAVMDWSNAGGEGYDTFKWDDDTIVVTYGDADPGDPPERIEPSNLGGELTQRWCIGGWSWVWSLAEPAPEGMV